MISLPWLSPGAVIQLNPLNLVSCLCGPTCALRVIQFIEKWPWEGYGFILVNGSRYIKKTGSQIGNLKSPQLSPLFKCARLQFVSSPMGHLWKRWIYSFKKKPYTMFSSLSAIPWVFHYISISHKSPFLVNTIHLLIPYFCSPSQFFLHWFFLAFP